MKALIIHSSSKILNYSISYLKEQNYTIDILTNSEKIKKENFGNRVANIIYFSMPKYDIKFFKNNKEKLYGYDLICVLYNIKKGIGYSNVDKLAFALKPKKIIGIDINKNIYNIDEKFLKEKIKKEKKNLLLSLINKLLTIIILIILLISITITDCIFKIYKYIKK